MQLAAGWGGGRELSPNLYGHRGGTVVGTSGRAQGAGGRGRGRVRRGGGVGGGGEGRGGGTGLHRRQNIVGQH